MAEVLVVGSGGREAAIAQAMVASSEVSRALVATDARQGLEAFSGGEKPFVVIGPEAPLVAGLADDLRAEGYSVFGAGKDAAQYEASKSRATNMMGGAGVDYPFTQDSYVLEQDLAWIDEWSEHVDQYVIKADGLAGGKGVVLPESYGEARQTVLGMRDGSLFDGAGKEIILFQHRHHGPEVSALVVVGADDKSIILPLSQDHKRLLDGDKGPNTGGMGAYAPVPSSIVSPEQYAQIENIVAKSLSGMRKSGVPFERGLLYCGLMLAKENADKPEIIEYNVRFGDPEAQPVLAILQKAGVDIYRLLRSAAEGDLEKPDVDFANIGYAALSVCLAAEGYPGTPRKGDLINGLGREYEGVSVQLAGIKRENDEVLTNGGRVLYVTGVGENIDEAAARAYDAIGPNAIDFANRQYRSDIGWQARSITRIES